MTSATPHVDDLMGAYALDAVDPKERAQVQAHIEQCERCRRELEEFTEAAVLLSNGHEVAPPAALRASILDAIAAQPQQARPPQQVSANEMSLDEVPSLPPAQSRSGASGSRAVWGLAAAGLLAVGGWGIWQGVSDDLSPIDQVIQADDARTVDVEYEGDTITVVSSASLDAAVLITEDLPELADDEVYQAWWVNADDQIVSAGVLDDGAGSDRGEVSLEGDPAGVVAFALSVEPVGGSPQPTTDPVVVVPLQS